MKLRSDRIAHSVHDEVMKGQVISSIVGISKRSHSFGRIVPQPLELIESVVWTPNLS